MVNFFCFFELIGDGLTDDFEFLGVGGILGRDIDRVAVAAGKEIEGTALCILRTLQRQLALIKHKGDIKICHTLRGVNDHITAFAYGEFFKRPVARDKRKRRVLRLYRTDKGFRDEDVFSAE